MLPQGSTTSTAVMTNTNTKTKINTNFLLKPKKHEEGLPFLSKVPVGATSKHLVHQSLVFRVLLENYFFQVITRMVFQFMDYARILEAR